MRAKAERHVDDALVAARRATKMHTINGRIDIASEESAIDWPISRNFYDGVAAGERRMILHAHNAAAARRARDGNDCRRLIWRICSATPLLCL